MQSRPKEDREKAYAIHGSPASGILTVLNIGDDT